MPHIRAGRAEQSAPRSPPQREPSSIAASFARDVLRLRSVGSSHRAIAAALGVSIRKVQTALKTGSPAERPFRLHERDADYAAVKTALAGGSTFEAEHSKYAARSPAPYSFSHFWRRYGDWCVAFGGFDEDGATNSIGAPLAGFAPLAGASVAPRKKMTFTGVYAIPEGAPLEGGLLFISEPDVALQIRKGALCIRYRDGGERTFPRGRHLLRSIILASPGASVTIEAMRFAIDEGITIFVMHRGGEAFAVLTDAPTVNASANALELRRAQFTSSPKQRLDIARAILAMKIEACELPERETQDALQSVARARDHAELLMVEAQAAKVYWADMLASGPA